nr:helix-turn-helix transcriptional regulator [Propionicimonas sp.]
MEISELLIAAREAAGMTQAGVAAARNVSRGAQSQIELAGARPGWDTIDSFAKAIDASVTVRFDLANGAVVSARCAGIRRPTLADDLFADADRARAGALAAGWAVGRDGTVTSAPVGYGEFATVQRLAAIIEPSNWNLQAALVVLMSMAAATGIDRDQGSDFAQEFQWLLNPFPEDEEDPPVYDVTAESQIALNALLYATRHTARDVLLYATRHSDLDALASYAHHRAAVLPVRGLTSYLTSGVPGAQEVADLTTRICVSGDWRLAILRQAGYLHGEPTQYDWLPHIVETTEA